MVDHVAMVLKFENDPEEVYFVDATNNNGVSLSRYSAIKPYLGSFYERVVYRKLEGTRNDELIDRLEVFLKEAIGHSYSITYSKLL